MADFAEKMMTQLLPFFEIFVLLLNVCSIVILLVGVARSMLHFFKRELPFCSERFDNNGIKNILGTYILLSLEVLIAADIIESIINPTLSDIMKLAALVLIRTVISYFLTKEIKEFSSKIEMP